MIQPVSFPRAGVGGRDRPAAQARPELSYGLGVTSNYIYRGTSQSNDNPAVQGYVEAATARSTGWWASTSTSTTTTSSSTLRRRQAELRRPRRRISATTAISMTNLAIAAANSTPPSPTRWPNRLARRRVRLRPGQRHQVGGGPGGGRLPDRLRGRRRHRTDFGSRGPRRRRQGRLEPRGLPRLSARSSTVDLRYHDLNYDPGRAVRLDRRRFLTPPPPPASG